MGSVLTAIEKVLDFPNPVVWIIEKLGGVWLCEKCNEISPELCEVVNDKPVWFRDLKYVKMAILVISAVAAFVYFVGPAVFYAGNFLPSLEGLFEEAMTLLLSPFKFLFWILSFGQGYVIWFNDFVSKSFGISSEILAALEITGLFIGLTDILIGLAKFALGQERDSYFWRIYNFLDTPIEWALHFWTKSFPSLWNPLHWLIYMPVIAGKIFIFVLTPLLNLLNPLRWIQKVTTMTA